MPYIILFIALLLSACSTYSQPSSKKYTKILTTADEKKALERENEHIDTRIYFDFIKKTKKQFKLNGPWDEYTKKSKDIYIDAAHDFMYAKTGILDQNHGTSRFGSKWYTANEICSNLEHNGISTWRLPTEKELGYLASAPKQLKPNLVYWSSTIENQKSNFPIAFVKRNENETSEYTNIFSKETRLRTVCVRSLLPKGLTFKIDSLQLLKIHRLYIYYFGHTFPISTQFMLDDNIGTLDELTYSNEPFKDISDLVQILTDVYLSPMEIDKYYYRTIPKPSLSPLPKFVKSQFETKIQFQTRINETLENRKAKIKFLQEKYRRDVEERNLQLNDILKRQEKVQIEKMKRLNKKIIEFQQIALKIVMGPFFFTDPVYDAETQSMRIVMHASNADFSKNLSISMPPKIAEPFYYKIKTVNAQPIFDFNNSNITLNSVKTVFKGKEFLAKSSTDQSFSPEKIEVVINEKKVDFSSNSVKNIEFQNPNLVDKFELQTITFKDGLELKNINYDDDLPSLISQYSPTSIDKKKWLITIGIENYSETDDIAFAERSAKLFKQVAKTTLGIQERNCVTLINDRATSGQIKGKLELLLTEVKEGDTIYFYYNGHGIPDPSHNGEPYMLPSDMIPDFVVNDKSFSLQNIYKKLTDSKASKIVAFIDSCFSGSTDGISTIKGVAASRLAPKQVFFDTSKMAVMTAGQKKQYSNMYKEKGHRLFSYFVMKSLLSGKRDINMIFKEVSYKVSETSNQFGALKKQEPTLQGNNSIEL